MNRKRKRKRYYYREHREKGLCGSCNSPAVKGRSLCQYHLDIRKEFYHKQREKGLCTVGGCSNFAIGGRNVCKEHLDKRRKSDRNRMRKVREIWRLEGKCTRCGVPLHKEMDEGCVTCINCRTKIIREMGVFRRKPSTHSDSKRPFAPIQSGPSAIRDM